MGFMVFSSGIYIGYVFIWGDTNILSNFYVSLADENYQTGVCRFYHSRMLISPKKYYILSADTIRLRDVIRLPDKIHLVDKVG